MAGSKRQGYNDSGCRWLGDASSVSAKAKFVVKVRTDGETGEPVAVRIPDHLDILVSLVTSSQLLCTECKRVSVIVIHLKIP